MKLGHAGEAFFVEDVPPPSPTHPPNSPLSDYLLTSPIIAPLSSPSSPQVSSPTFFSPSRSRSCSPPPADFLPSGIPMTSSSPIPHSPSFTSPSSPSPVPFSSPSFSPSDSPRRTKPTLSSSHSSSSLPIGKRGHSKSQLIQKERVGEKENDPVGEEGLALTSFLTSRIAEFDDDGFFFFFSLFIHCFYSLHFFFPFIFSFNPLLLLQSSPQQLPLFLLLLSENKKKKQKMSQDFQDL